MKSKPRASGPAWVALAAALLVALAPGALAQEKARAPEAASPAPGAAESPASERGPLARLAVASDPPGATVVLFTSKTGAPVAAKFGSDDSQERILGRTPLDLEIPAGRADVVVAKDGFVLKVEPVELRAGSAQRLEVRLARDIAIPEAISFKDGASPGTPPFVKTQAQAEQLVDMVLSRVVGLFVEEKDPRALVGAAVKTLVGSLEAVREREALLRRELGDEARARFYADEVDLRSYPALSFSETELADGRKRWSVAAGSFAAESVTDPGDYDSYRRELHSVFSFVKSRWDTAGKLDDGMLARACIEGILGSLDDAHTHFLPPAALKDMNDETHGTFGGVGIVVAAKDGHLTVIAPMEGTPGEKAGILAGDWILAIDGRPTDGLSLSEAVKAMRGDPDTEIELTLRRGEGAPWKVKLTRANIAIRYTKREVLKVPTAGGGSIKIGYLRITSFMSEKLDEDVAKALDELDAEGVTGLVLDLRNNPGGLLTEAVAIADMWVPANGLIVETRGRIAAASKDALATDGPKRRREPIAILVNEGSASASEILAGTLREHGLAVLVGERTFGKGSVQRVITLDPFESALALTVATYHFKSGFTPHKKGLIPDVVVALTEEEKLRVASRSVYSTAGEGSSRAAPGAEASKDRQLEAALAEVMKKLP
jgi:carboxyl-terminal processing protease